jgi:hypothetical protein
MDNQTKLTGLDQFVATVFEGGTSLDSLLDTLGFDAAQRASIGQRHLPAIAAGLIEVIRRRLTWEDKDLWFRIIARRLGLDGEPPASLEATAQALNIDPPYAAYAEGEALQKCRTKTALEEFKKEVRRIALEELAQSGEKPGRENVLQKLERLAQLHAAADLARMDYEARRAEVMKKVQEELDVLEAEFKPALDAAEMNTGALGAEIKNDILLRGESLRGSMFQAIYMKGRVSWDATGMNEYARDHPDVLRFRKESQPSVTLRVTGKASADERN